MKRGKSKGLRKAARLYRRRKYTQAINLLEPQVFMYRDSWQYYQILGMSCLYTGDYAGAYSYLRRAFDIDPERNETLLGIGAVLLRRRQLDLAIQNYLDMLDQSPQHRRARRALQWIRRLDNPDDVVDWFEDGRIRKILPPRGAYIPVPVVIVVAAALILATSFLVGPRLIQSLSDLFEAEQRTGTEVLDLSRDIPRITDTDEPRYIFTEEEIDQRFRDIERAFNDNRDNLVRRELNRITLSNASPRVMRQAELLREYLQEPDFTTFRDNATIEDVVAEPKLYDGVFVRWRGRIANLVVGDEEITFDLLVGYEDGRVLDGIVPVQVPFAVLLDDGRRVEILGAVNLRDEQRFSVTATDVRMLAPTEVSE